MKFFNGGNFKTLKGAAKEIKTLKCKQSLCYFYGESTARAK